MHAGSARYLALAVAALLPTLASAQAAQVAQVPLDGSLLPKFVDSVPTFEIGRAHV